jgi:hypothetical protein
MLSITQTEINVDSGGFGYRSRTVAALRGLGIPDADILDGVRVYLRAQIDGEAERLRGTVMTPGVGQAMEYQQAQAEAKAALASPKAATAEAYPMLAASIGVDIDPETRAPAADVLGVARSVSAAFKAWLETGAAIRGVRLSVKGKVDAATTVEDAIKAATDISWPSV